MCAHHPLLYMWDAYHSMACQEVPCPRQGSKPANPRTEAEHANLTAAPPIGAPLCFFLKDFIFPFSPQSPPVQSCVFLVVGPSGCGMPPQHGLMSAAMSTLRIQTGESLGSRSGEPELNHLATGPAPKIVF